jgi:polyisoprenyl-phosphate glycosyltransferase
LLRRMASIDIPPDAGDFRLVDRKVINAFQAMPERDRFVRGMFAWMGFRQCGIPFARMPRAAGATKYPLRKMIRLAASGVYGFSDAPLRAIVQTGFAVALLSLLSAVATLVMRVLGVPLVPGWASLMLAIAFFMGLNFIVLGIVGLYVGRIYEEVKARPLYLVRAIYGAAGTERKESAGQALARASFLGGHTGGLTG